MIVSDADIIEALQKYRGIVTSATGLRSEKNEEAQPP